MSALGQKQTCAVHQSMSALPPIATAKANIRHSFNQLVGDLLEMQWHREAERFGSLEVDDQIEIDRRLDGKLARFRALEDAISI